MTPNLTWEALLSEEQNQPYFQSMIERIESQRKEGKAIYPAKQDVFNAMIETRLEDVKVVILGQDPYHGPNQAHGLSFSVLPGVKTPPSLVNIYKELAQDIEGFERPNHGYLMPWAKQGVLLLNTVLTVEEGKAHSHAKLGWEQYTDRVIEVINEHCQGVVFMLWGAHAQKKGHNIDTTRHHVLTAPHPSPLSARRGFFGCQHFSIANRLIAAQGKTPIEWHLQQEI